MKILNLVYPDKSDIQYEIQKFPDGQQNIIITAYNGKQTEPVKIKSRLNNFKDLELIICSVASLCELGLNTIHLYVPYIMGARSDRKFQAGGNNYIKDVLAPIINSLNFESVTCVDPHSDVLEACINRFKKESNLYLLAMAMNNIYNDFLLVCPDAGASKKIYKVAEYIGYKNNIITCSKDRDVNGNLTKIVFPFETHKYNGQDFIIVDDICDGGATFINIARKIKDCLLIREANQQIKPGKIYLIVTHGVFSKTLENVMEHFDGIFCTNSYSDTQYLPDITDEVGAEHKIFKQLNIF